MQMGSDEVATKQTSNTKSVHSQTSVAGELSD